MTRWLAFWLTSGPAWVAFYSLRLAERLLCVRVLSVLLWLPAAGWGLVELRWRQLAAAWRRFPESWRPEPLRYFLRRTFGHPHARLVYAWPDRLRSSRWSSRCLVEGSCDLTQLRDSGRRLVFASLHFGPVETLPYWLRAKGVVVTTLRGKAHPWTRLKRRQYALSPPPDVPAFLTVNHLQRVRQFLGPGGRLLVMVDVNRGKQVDVPFDDHLFRMATGAIRPAASAEAKLIPCLIFETTPWHFTLHFGTPVPRIYLGRSPDVTAAAAHLLSEFLKVVSLYPEQCGRRLLSSISPAAKRVNNSTRAWHKSVYELKSPRAHTRSRLREETREGNS
jgi:lauroyl/myristoyl acyltransferase